MSQAMNLYLKCLKVKKPRVSVKTTDLETLLKRIVSLENQIMYLELETLERNKGDRHGTNN